MKKNILILFFLIISVSGLLAQPTVVKLNGFKQPPTITYTTKDVVVKFDKQSFLDMYTSVESGGWVSRYAREYKAATVAIAWLKNQKKLVQLDENMTDQSKSETGLVWLVQNLVGAPLILKGEIEVYELKGNKKRDAIAVVVGHSPLSGDSYSLSFPGQSNEFLKIWNVNAFIPVEEEIAPTVEIAVAENVEGVGEVVFEEPVEEVVVDDPNKVYVVVEIPAEFPGGYDKWNEYLKKSLKYPKDAAKMQIEGSVFVQFVVQETGKLTDFTVIKGISASCDKEAIRLCKESIDWKPAKQRGKVVKQRFVMPIKFRLADLEKK